MADLVELKPVKRTIEVPELLTIEEASKVLRVSYSTAYRMANDGSLPVWRASRNKRTIRIPKVALLKMIESQTVPAA